MKKHIIGILIVLLIGSAVIGAAAEELLPVALEAEDAILTGSARPVWVTETLTYDNQKVGFIDDENATVTFSITVPQENDYVAVFRVSGNQNEYQTVPQHAVYINGDKAHKMIVSYPDAHVWNEWHEYPVTLHLQKGENKVTVTHSGNWLTYAELDRVVFYVPGTWLKAQTEGLLTTQRVAKLPGSSYTFDATLHQALNPTVSGIALTSEDGQINYMLEANATEHMLKFYRATPSGGSWNIVMKGTKKFSGIKWAATAKLRLAVNGNHLRAYYLNEVGGEEPWQEFDFVLDDLDKVDYASVFAAWGETVLLSTSLTEGSFTIPNAAFQNPVIYGLADPDVIYDNGMFYAYGTYSNTTFDVFKSPDLVHWEKKENILANPVPWWGADINFWAPGVAKIDGRYYMAGSINFAVGFFVSDSPEGPFYLIGDGPVFPNESIDANIFVDDDGRVYVYYVSWENGDYGIFGIEYNRTLTAPLSGRVKLLAPDAQWEMYGVAITEGPYMLKHNGTYYLTYSGSDYLNEHYAVGYATMSSPLGPATKYQDNPILTTTQDFQGTGHHGFVSLPNGDLYLVYHAHKNVGTEDLFPRNVCIAKARFTKSHYGADYLEFVAPSAAPQPMPIDTCYGFFADNGASGSMDMLNIPYAQVTQLPPSGFQKDGYVQIGWTVGRWRTGKWACLMPDGSVVWAAAGEEPAGSAHYMMDLEGAMLPPFFPNVDAGEAIIFQAEWAPGDTAYRDDINTLYVKLPKTASGIKAWTATYQDGVLCKVSAAEVSGKAGETVHIAIDEEQKQMGDKTVVFLWREDMTPLFRAVPVP